MLKIHYVKPFSISNLFKNNNYTTSKDRITGLPNLVSIFPILEKTIEKSSLSLLYIDIENFKTIETIYGRETCNKVLIILADILRKNRIVFFGSREKLAICSLGGDDFLLFVDTPSFIEDYETNYTKIKNSLEDEINTQISLIGIKHTIKLHIGYTTISNHPGYNIESLVYQAIKEVSYVAKNCRDAQEHAHWNQLKDILNQKLIRIDYQPIISLKSGKILGYEALTRGPTDTFFESPQNLFHTAQSYDRLLDLESLAHSMALSGFSNNSKDAYLFLNISPLTVNPNTYHKSFLQKLLQQNQINPQNIVLELTERNSIDNYDEFREHLRYYRNLGFMVAIDDAGAGYSSLQAIAELQPEFVKIDMSLVRGIDKNLTKKALLETFVNFSYKIGARIICEGIETVEELTTLTSMGCDFGQGFIISRPGQITNNISSEIHNHINVNSTSNKFMDISCCKIGDIAMYQNSVEPDTSVKDIINYFNSSKSSHGIVVCKNNHPIGLVMRDRLFSLLGTRYGYDLFEKRPVTSVMDQTPLILPYFTSIEDTANQVAQRLDRGITDYVVVIKDDAYFGVVSIAKMLETMAKQQLLQAKDANPLTGLPGNRCISNRIVEDLSNNKEFTILYFDLDNFKAFNDYFGFEKGDRAINLTAELIKKASKEYGNVNDLVGHIGGDDFILITSSKNKAKTICEYTIKWFDRLILTLYDKDSIDKGYIVCRNRKGELTQIPIMSISIAGVNHSKNSIYLNQFQLTEIAAEVKKSAKAIKGSIYVFDSDLNIC